MTAPSDRAFLDAFLAAADDDPGYAELDNLLRGEIGAADSGDLAEAIRCQLSDAVGDAARAAGLPCDTAEEEGRLADLVCDAHPHLNEYLVATTE